jgi:hypothetical protein
MPTPPPTRWRRNRWRLLSALGAGVLVVAVMALGTAATCRPAWYQPMAIDYGRLKSDEAELADLLDGIGAALNRGQRIDLTIDEAQLNRWIVARGELWRDARVEFAGLSDPQVRLSDAGHLWLAATTTYGGAGVVVWAVLRPELTPEVVRLHVDSLQVGQLPIPASSVLAAAGEALGGSRAGRPSIVGRVIEWPNRWVWPNGKRPMRIGRLAISRGVLEVSLEPAGGGP